MIDGTQGHREKLPGKGHCWAETRERVLTGSSSRRQVRRLRPGDYLERSFVRISRLLSMPKIVEMLQLATRSKTWLPYLGSLKQSRRAPCHKARSIFDRSSPRVRISGDTIVRRWNIEALARMGSGVKVRQPKGFRSRI